MKRILIIMIIAIVAVSCDREEIEIRNEPIDTTGKMLLECVVNSDTIMTNTCVRSLMFDSYKSVSFRPDTLPCIGFFYDTLAIIDSSSFGQDCNMTLKFRNSAGSITATSLNVDEIVGTLNIETIGDTVLNAEFDITTLLPNWNGEDYIDTVMHINGSINGLRL